MYISRTDAERKYRISSTRMRQLERKGKLVPLDASTVAYKPPAKARGGSAVKVVYEEAQVAALFGTKGADTRFARRQRFDAVVFDLLADGVDVPDIVRRTRLDLATVLRLRDFYVREKDGIVVPGAEVRAMRENGFDLRPDNMAEVMQALREYGRGIKPSKERLARWKMFSEDGKVLLDEPLSEKDRLARLKIVPEGAVLSEKDRLARLKIVPDND
jgi:hypothetical protein